MWLLLKKAYYGSGYDLTMVVADSGGWWKAVAESRQEIEPTLARKEASLRKDLRVTLPVDESFILALMIEIITSNHQRAISFFSRGLFCRLLGVGRPSRLATPT